MKTLKRIGRWAILVIGVLFLLALGWGMGIEPRLIGETHLEEHIDGLPAAWQGREVAVMSDLQIGIVLDNDGTVRRMVDRIVEARPAAVLLVGDFVYVPGDPDASDEIARVQDLLRPLTAAGLPTFAVLGNHDYGQIEDASEPRQQLANAVAAALDEIGIRVLRNEASPLRTRQSDVPLWIVGIGPHRPDRVQVAQAFGAVPPGAPRVVMLHNPRTFAHIPAEQAPLSFAGHTHAGQIRVPFLESWSWLHWAWEGEIHADGWAEPEYGAPGNRLYVTRGVGFSIVPIRINSPPELVFTELQGSQALTGSPTP